MARTPAMPTLRLTDEAFVYTPAVATNIKERFAAVRAAQAQAARKQARAQQALDLAPDLFGIASLPPSAIVLQLRPPAKRKAPATRRAA